MNLFKYLFIICCCTCLCVNQVNADCTPTVSVIFSEDGKSVKTISSKDLSNVVLKFCDGTADYKFDSLNVGKVYTFSLNGKQLSGVWVKSGCNKSGDGPGYGEFFERECTTDCLGVIGGTAELDECGVCNGNGPGECGCDLNVVKDACGICGGPGEGPCGCNDLVRDECGVCGGDGPGECGCNFNITQDECGVCGGDGPGLCGCDEVPDACSRCPEDPDYGNPSCVQCDGVIDECGICNGPGKNECGTCPGEEEIVKDDCGICGGSGKDSCGFCPEDSNFNVGKDRCGVCPGEVGYGEEPCVDCLGIVDGPHVEDTEGQCCLYEQIGECGKCGGSGPNECNSCIGDLTCTCEDVSIFEESIQIDSYSKALYVETKKAGRTLKRYCTSRKCKRLVKKLTLKASDLHMKIWTSIWTIGGEYTTCDPDACLVVDLTDIKQSLTEDYLLMQKGVRKLYKKAFRRSGGKKGIRRKLRRSNHKTKVILQLIDFILPNEKSVCN